ncbi:MAG: peptide chain release factor N(5)-glutamine methyltransferase [Candidatus Saccharicenans sp.]
MNHKTLDWLFRQTARELSFSSCPFIEARLFIQHSARMTEAEFFHHLDSPVLVSLEKKVNRLVEKRKAGWPVAYLLGKKEFWSLEFKVNRWVLIPRPETELLVEAVLSLSLSPGPAILDVGTGCGNIAVALANERPDARVIGSDISRLALKVAEFNAKKNKVKNIKFVLSNLLTYFWRRKIKFEVIVSNPPYVSEADWAKLDRPVKDFEPKKALVSGPTGLEIIEKLIKQAPGCLKPGGYLILEIGAGQEGKVPGFFSDIWQKVRVLSDYSGRPRLVIARKRS